MSGREKQVTEAFVAIATTLARGYDVVEMLNGLTGDCARLLDIASAGLLLADRRGVLHVLAASSERARELEVHQLQRDDGPCLDCFRDGAPVSVADLSAQEERWPAFVPAARAAGYRSVHAVPLRLQDTVLGAMGLFGAEVGPLNDDDLVLGQALADVASVALVQDRTATNATALSAQLQGALTSRVVLEQAKGVIAQQSGTDVDEAFDVLRGYARDHHQRLTDVARAVVARNLPARRLVDHARSKITRGPAATLEA